MIFTKVSIKILLILSICIFSGNTYIKANDNKCVVEEMQEISQDVVKTIGNMKLMEIDPLLNPAEDNWLSKEIAGIIFGDESRYAELTQEHFNVITNLNYICLNRMVNIPEGFLPTQIGNLVNVEEISINASLCNYNDLKLPKEIQNLSKLNELTIRGVNFNDKNLKEILRLSNLTYLCLSNNDKEFLIMD